MTSREIPTAVYRFYDSNDVLLYIGITENPAARFASHRSDKAWWPDVARHTIEWRGTREDALTAEAAAIVAERPVWNVAGSPCPPEKPIAPWIRRAIDAGDTISITDARKDLTGLIASVKHLRRSVIIFGHGKPRGLLAPTELGDAVVAAGGPDAAVQILRDHVKSHQG